MPIKAEYSKRTIGGQQKNFYRTDNYTIHLVSSASTFKIDRAIASILKTLRGGHDPGQLTPQVSVVKALFSKEAGAQTAFAQLLFRRQCLG